MSSSFRVTLIVAGSLLVATACSAKAAPVPAPEVDAARSAISGQQTAVVAGGCFWGVQAVFQHLKGVLTATSGMPVVRRRLLTVKA